LYCYTPGSRATKGGAAWTPRSPVSNKALETGDQSEFTEYSEFENDGDYVVTEMHVVTTPRERGAGARGRRFFADDGDGDGDGGGMSSGSGSDRGRNDDSSRNDGGNGKGGGGKGAVDDLRRQASRSRLSLPNLQINAGDIDDDDEAAVAAAAEDNAADIAAANATGDLNGGGNNKGGKTKAGSGGGGSGVGRALIFGGGGSEPAAASGSEHTPVAAVAAAAAAAAAMPPKGGTPSWGLLPPMHHGASAGPSAGVGEGKITNNPADRAVARALKSSFHSAADSPLVQVSANAEGASTSASGGGGEASASASAKSPSKGGSSNHNHHGQGGHHDEKRKTTHNHPPLADGGGSGNHGVGAGSSTNSAEYSYGRVLAPEDELTSECEEVCLMVQHCMKLREKYLFVSELEKDPSRVKPPLHSPHYPMKPGLAKPNPASPTFSHPTQAFADFSSEGGGGGGTPPTHRRAPRGSSVTTGKVKIVPDDELPGASNHFFEMVAGVMHVYEGSKKAKRTSVDAAARGGNNRKVSTGSDPGAWSTTQDVDEDEVLGGGVIAGGAASSSHASERVLKFAPPATATVGAVHVDCS
jgi:hypothetical protein